MQNVLSIDKVRRTWKIEGNKHKTTSKNKRLQTFDSMAGRSANLKLREKRANPKNDDSPTFKLVSRSEKCRCCPLLLKTRIWESSHRKRLCHCCWVISAVVGQRCGSTFSRIAIKLSEMKQWIRMRASSLPRETDPTSNSSSKRIAINKRQDGTSSGRLLQNGFFPSFLLALFCFSLFRCSAQAHFSRKRTASAALPPWKWDHDHPTKLVRGIAAIQRRLTLLYSPPDIQLSVEVSEPNMKNIAQDCVCVMEVRLKGKFRVNGVGLVDRKENFKTKNKIKGRNKTKLLTASPFHSTTKWTQSRWKCVAAKTENERTLVWASRLPPFEITSRQHSNVHSNKRSEGSQSILWRRKETKPNKATSVKRINIKHLVTIISNRNKEQTIPKQLKAITTKRNKNINRLSISTTKWTQSRWKCVAVKTGNQRTLFWASMFARFQMRNLATFKCPWSQAKWRGVQPYYGGERKQNKESKISQTNKHQTPCHIHLKSKQRTKTPTKQLKAITTKRCQMSILTNSVKGSPSHSLEEKGNKTKKATSVKRIHIKHLVTSISNRNKEQQQNNSRRSQQNGTKILSASISTPPFHSTTKWTQSRW